MNKSIILFLIAAVTAAYQSSQSECDSEYKKLCETKSTDTKSNCLQINFDKIEDKVCKSFLETNRQKWLEKSQSFELMKKSCDIDTTKYCGEDSSSRKDILVCLMVNGENLQASCKLDINRHIKEFLPGINSIK